MLARIGNESPPAHDSRAENKNGNHPAHRLLTISQGIVNQSSDSPETKSQGTSAKPLFCHPKACKGQPTLNEQVSPTTKIVMSLIAYA